MFKKTCILIKNVGDLKGDLKKLSDTLHTDGWVQRSHFLISKVPFKKVKRVAFQRNFKWDKYSYIIYETLLYIFELRDDETDA